MSVFVFSILLTGISHIYSRLYCVSRKIGCADNGRKKLCATFAVCFCSIYLILITAEKTMEISYMIRLLLLALLSGIDIFIRKIPTELLAAAAFFFVISAVHIPLDVFRFLSPVLIGFVFYLFRNRTGMGLYDILLFMLLAMTSWNMVTQLKFTAVFLILWGVSGLIIGKLKNRKDLTIPLVPLITFSYYAVQTIL